MPPKMKTLPTGESCLDLTPGEVEAGNAYSRKRQENEERFLAALSTEERRWGGPGN
jgi:hypothetical protein